MYVDFTFEAASAESGIRADRLEEVAKTIAAAGTSLARIVPRRSVNEIRKYSIPLSFAAFARSVAMIPRPCCLR